MALETQVVFAGGAKAAKKEKQMLHTILLGLNVTLVALKILEQVRVIRGPKKK